MFPPLPNEGGRKTGDHEMTDAKYLGMRPGDLDDKPYANYWNPEMGSMPSHVQRALMRGVEARERIKQQEGTVVVETTKPPSSILLEQPTSLAVRE